MSTQASESQKTEPASTEGFEDLLEVQEIIENTDSHDPPLTGLDPCRDLRQDYWTVEEASKILSVSQRTIFRRLKKGSLTGVKVDGPFGEEWRIHPTLLSHDIPLERGGQDQDSGLDIGHDSPTPDENKKTSQLESEIEFLRNLVNNQSHQLKAASDVVVYLKTQLDTKDEQIKLLADSQHKAGWLNRFSRWFFGR